MKIDKELVSMCACLEIQGGWLPKRGDRFVGGSGIEVFVLDFITPDTIRTIFNNVEATKSKSVYIPRIEDMVNMIKETGKVPELTGIYFRNITVKSLLIHWMGIGHNKCWNGSKWKDL